jgi:hypothetical protein
MMLSDFKKAFVIWDKHNDHRIVKKIRWVQHTDGINLLRLSVGDDERGYYCSFPENTVMVIKERPC